GDSDLRTGREPDTAGPSHAWGRRIACHLMRCLCHAVRLDQRASEDFLDVANDLWRNGGRCGPVKRQRIVLDDCRALACAPEDRLMHGRYGRVPGRSCFGHPAEELERIESSAADHRTARAEWRKEAGDQAMNVKQRHQIEAAIMLGEPERRYDIEGRGAQ